jgi:hypothetical protein
MVLSKLILRKVKKNFKSLEKRWQNLITVTVTGQKRKIFCNIIRVRFSIFKWRFLFTQTIELNCFLFHSGYKSWPHVAKSVLIALIKVLNVSCSSYKHTAGCKNHRGKCFETKSILFVKLLNLTKQQMRPQTFININRE